jgi:hypothetical protein
MVEPMLYYIGALGWNDSGECTQGAWTPDRRSNPATVLGMPGLWRHPALPIPFDHPRPKING